ncbi:UvrD-helicase domain-containing protein [Aeromonas dhakensis]|uniref:UvrD-helicase domain-containing protein n=1 Tax=Aeromonas dhakensis TaxID=196024 RepID=UPI0038CF75F1
MSNKLIDEAQVTQTLFDTIDRNDSFIFSAGAGSGKTYALIECLKYILRNNFERLRNNNQQMVCITYTNVAVNEIRTRLGNSDTIIVSTIHEMLWSIIQRFQSELVLIHLSKISSELEKLDAELSSDPNDKLGFFTLLSLEDQNSCIELIRNTKEIYYAHQNSNSATFKAAYTPFEDKYGKSKIHSWLRNYKVFQEVAKRIYRKDRYTQCIENIKSYKNGYTAVIYDNKFNADRLDKMRFSHDTLLEYSYSLINTYPLLSRLIIDKYPYFFIDEYQDTNKHVVNLIRLIYDFSINNKRDWLVGYFGDTAQTIYPDGIGIKLETLYSDLKTITKIYNRRSHLQIIDTANAIRNDDISQVPINDGRNQGNVIFYYAPPENDKTRLDIAKKFIEKYIVQVGDDDGIDCLVLTNKLMAEMNGFGDIYHAFKQAENIYYDDLNTKLLSNELDKLDPTIRIIYKIVNLYLLVNNHNSTYYELFGDKGRIVKFSEANNFLKKMRAFKAITLGDFLSEISNYYIDSPNSPPLNVFINSFFGSNFDDVLKHKNIQSFIKYLLKELMLPRSEGGHENDDLEIARVDNILNIRLETWALWVNYINETIPGPIRYHTYHGTKGEEYSNVAIIMEHSFGRNSKGRDKFKKFFLYRASTDETTLPTPDDDDIFNTRNLIYVACSRAIKNLWVLYLDDIDEIEGGLNKIFKKIEPWKSS